MRARVDASVPDVVSIASVGVGKEPGKLCDESRELSQRFNKNECTLLGKNVESISVTWTKDERKLRVLKTGR